MTEFARSSSIVSSITILKGKSEMLSIDHVASTITIPFPPTINLRQSSALPFVTIFNGASSAIVTIDTNAVAVGDYTLALESFESSADSLLTTLYTDIVTVQVYEYIRS